MGISRKWGNWRIKPGRVQRKRGRGGKFLKQLNNEIIFLMTDNDACSQSLSAKYFLFRVFFHKHCFSETFLLPLSYKLEILLGSTNQVHSCRSTFLKKVHTKVSKEASIKCLLCVLVSHLQCFMYLFLFKYS